MKLIIYRSLMLKRDALTLNLFLTMQPAMQPVQHALICSRLKLTTELLKPFSNFADSIIYSSLENLGLMH